LIDRSSNRNDINNHFQTFGLHGLRFDNSTPQGGWRNPDGAGVGKLQMTSWDCLRLLWLMLDASGEAGVSPPWLSTSRKSDSTTASNIGQHFISESSAKRFWHWMERQALHEVLSSSLLCGLPNWVQGIPARLPKLWINAQGQAQIGPERWPGNFLSQQDRASVNFAHKTEINLVVCCQRRPGFFDQTWGSALPDRDHVDAWNSAMQHSRGLSRLGLWRVSVPRSTLGLLNV